MTVGAALKGEAKGLPQTINCFFPLFPTCLYLHVACLGSQKHSEFNDKIISHSEHSIMGVLQLEIKL